MKTRIGFVSNSSSSSFVILGVSISEKDRARLHELTQLSPRDYRSKLKGLDIISASGKTIIGKKSLKWNAPDRNFKRPDNNDTTLSSPSMSFHGRTCVMFMPKFIGEEDLKIKKVLEPLGLWNDDQFGVYCGTDTNPIEG